MMVIENSDSAQSVQSVADILIVEDEQIIALNMRESLESLGYRVSAIASSASKAIEKATTLRPNLVLMDICLKGAMDGIEAAEYIWTTLQIPVIYVTGHSDPNTLNRATATAPFGYILKPIREKELYIAIETALQRSTRERWLLSVFRGMGDGIIVTDVQGRVQFLNPTAEMLTGWEQTTARDQPLTTVFQVVDPETGEPILDRVLAALIQSNTPLFLESPVTLISKQGHTIPIADSIAAFRDNTDAIAGIVIVFRNITEQLKAAERDLAVERAKQLEQQVAEMQRLDRLKEDFLSTISHELRTPLSNIQLATRMLTIVLDQLGILAQDETQPTSMLKRYIQILTDQSQQELSLVNDLLDLQRINGDSYPIDWGVVFLPDWIPHVVEAFEARVAENQQQLVVTLSPGLGDLQTDAQLLTRIISELLNNACKYTPPDGVITVAIDLADATTDEVTRSHLLIHIANPSDPISPEDQARIFEPFYRIPHRDRWAKSGTGLGLALVKKFAGYLGGNISVSSAAGQVCFTLMLPVFQVTVPQ